MSRKPHYALRDVKTLIKTGRIQINSDAASDAFNDFGWRTEDMKKCLLKLNDRPHRINSKNHYYKTKPHYRFRTGTLMDYYKAINIMEGNDVYTHFYIHPHTGKLVISSFKEL